jgi:radical SAM protein (TIGR01212 family)
MWGDKRYYSLDYYLKKEYGKKIYKLSLNGGMTCPNRDGNLGSRGCIFCSAGGSGDFAASPLLSITEQIEEAKKLVLSKLKGNQETQGGQFIAYFQAYTNTYADIAYLRKIFTEAVMHPDIMALSIATRPDCLGNDVLDLLEELNKIKSVWIELGLQTCHENTANFIRRGYPLSVFEEAVGHLHSRNIIVIVHVIIGLPGESVSDMLNTISYVSTLPIHGIKLQLLHILKNTDLADYPYEALTMEEYISIIISCLEILPPDIVIHRLTGDGPKSLLIAPLWSANKKQVLNGIQKELKLRDTWQGKRFNSSSTRSILAHGQITNESNN